MRNVANDGLTKLRRLNAINTDPEQHLNLSKSLDGLNERSNGPDGRRQIPDRDQKYSTFDNFQNFKRKIFDSFEALSRSQHLPLNQM